jgi:hypothetical protein
MEPNGEHYQRACDAVVGMIDEHGRSLLRSPDQFTAVLADIASGWPKPHQAILAAVDAGVLPKLSDRRTLTTEELDQLAATVVHNDADWAVRTLAAAGRITIPEPADRQAPGWDAVATQQPTGSTRATGTDVESRAPDPAPTLATPTVPASPVTPSSTKRSWILAGAIITVLLVTGAAVSIRGTAGTGATEEQEQSVAVFTPSETNRDPSKAITGIQVATFAGGQHVGPDQRVAYTHSPPYGGAHDYNWAACVGIVYPTAVRNENMVHSLEHGAVWIAYDPARIGGDGLAALRRRVAGQPYAMMSPYPGLDQPISLQSWGHQLKLADPDDPRIDQFIQALRVNQYQHPEVGASCAALGPGQFDQDNPPSYDPSSPGPGATPEGAAR